MNIKILLFVVLLIPTVSASECPKNVYYLTPEYVFADGNMVFKYIDMDLSKDGIQNILRVRPGELVTVEVSWAWGPNCPDCTVYINSFGSWAPDNDIMKLYSGPKGGASSVSRTPISFLAPDTPGEYEFRIIFAYDKEYAADFDGSNLCSTAECQTRGECSILIAEGDINVTMLTPAGTIPLSLKITSPKTTEVSGILKANVGAIIPIHADINIPPNTTVNITVKIDDNEVSSLLPYSWNTFDSSVGSHRIVVTAKDETGNLAYDEFMVLLQNRTGAYGVIPPLLWRQRIKGIVNDIDISEKGSYIVAGSDDGFVYLFDRGGRKIWEYPLSGPVNSVALSSGGKNLLSASGNVLYYFNEDGSLIWTYSSSTEIKSVAMNRDGDRIALTSGNVLYYVDDLASLLWNLTDITDVAISSDGRLILAKSDNILLAINKGGSIIWQEVSENILGTISISPDGKFLTYSEGESVFLRDNSRITISERSRIWIYAAIMILAVLAVGIFVKRKRISFVLQKIRIKRAESEEGGREAPLTTAPVEVATLKIRVINYKTKRPIKAAKTLIENRITVTDENGEATLKDVRFGERTITVEKELYQPTQKTCVVGEGKNFVEIGLTPKVMATSKNEETLKGIMYNLSKAYESVSSYDTCLPNYYKSIGGRIIEFLEMLSYSPELIEAGERKEFIDSFVEVGSMTCNGLLDVMTDWRNVKLYQAASELEKTECDAKEVKIEALHAIFTSPESLGREIESRLSTLDNRMMEHMSKLTIIPVSTLWQVSKELLSESSTASGYRKLATLFFANVLTSHTNDMFEKEEIVKRLEFSLL